MIVCVASDCQDTFVKTQNKNANGATGYNDGDVAACEVRCLGMANCVAFDFDPSASGLKCWIHTDVEQAKNLKDANGVTHYARKACKKGGCCNMVSCN